MMLVSGICLALVSAAEAEEISAGSEPPPALFPEGHGMEPSMGIPPYGGPMMPSYYPPSYSPYVPVVQYRPYVTYYPNPYYQTSYGMPPMAPPMPPAPQQGAGPPVPVMPTKLPPMLYSNGTIIKPKVYVPGFPIRNVFQAMTP